jgi:hypothetical protein
MAEKSEGMCYENLESQDINRFIDTLGAHTSSDLVMRQ